MSTPRSLTALEAAGLVAAEDRQALSEVAERYAVALTPALVSRIDASDPGDPLARQFLPSAAELDGLAFEQADPIGDAAHSPVAGLVHRYPDRVLLMPSHACPVYCRFCFRREVVGPGSPRVGPEDLDRAMAYIEAHTGVFEVILSGGDPLALSARRLRQILTRLDAIPHIGVVRIHTRVPVLDPQRIHAELVALLRRATTVWVVVHTNHERELDAEARVACARLVDAGIPLLAQTVLLAGVNDGVPQLEALFRALVRLRIKPYYLHHADLAPGTSHFRVPLERGQELVRQLRGALSGICQPTYVLDLPGGYGKVPVGPTYARPGERPGEWRIEDPLGHAHIYPPV